MADFLCDKTLFQDYLGGDEGARFVVERIVGRALTVSVSSQTVMELWLEEDFSRGEEIKYSALLSFMEEAPFSVEAARLASSWLIPLPNGEREDKWGYAVTAAIACQRGETILTRRGHCFTPFYPAVASY